MEIILLESFDKLGKIGDTVNVKDGFARNFLLPQKKALRANKENTAHFEKIKKGLEEKNKDLVNDAKKLSSILIEKDFVFIRQASDTGQLYGSVSPKDISTHFKELKINIPPSNINLSSAIKNTGIFKVIIKLHADVSVTVKLNVAVSKESAETQKNLTLKKNKNAKIKVSSKIDSNSNQVSEKSTSEKEVVNGEDVISKDDSTEEDTKLDEKPNKE